MSIFKIGRQGAGSPPLSGGAGAWVISWQSDLVGTAWAGSQFHVTSQFTGNNPILRFSTGSIIRASWQGAFRVRASSAQSISNQIEMAAYKGSSGDAIFSQISTAPVEAGNCSAQNILLLSCKGTQTVGNSDGTRLRLSWDSRGGTGRTVCLKEAYVYIVVQLVSGELVTEAVSSYAGVPFQVTRLY